jgi:hypothetical protein
MRLTSRRLVSSVACLALTALFASAPLAQSDPQVGVWKLNLAKSKYSPGPAPKSGTVKIEAAGADDFEERWQSHDDSVLRRVG